MGGVPAAQPPKDAEQSAAPGPDGLRVWRADRPAPSRSKSRPSAETWRRRSERPGRGSAKHPPAGQGVLAPRRAHGDRPDGAIRHAAGATRAEQDTVRGEDEAVAKSVPRGVRFWSSKSLDPVGQKRLGYALAVDFPDPKKYSISHDAELPLAVRIIEEYFDEAHQGHPASVLDCHTSPCDLVCKRPSELAVPLDSLNVDLLVPDLHAPW